MPGTPLLHRAAIALLAMIVAGALLQGAASVWRGQMQEGENMNLGTESSAGSGFGGMFSSLGEAGSSSETNIVSSVPLSSDASSAPPSSGGASSGVSSASCGGVDITYSALAGDKDGFGTGGSPSGMTYSTYGSFVPDGSNNDAMDRPLLSNFGSPATQYPYYTPNMTAVPRMGGGLYPDATFVIPPIPNLATVPVANMHRAWIRFHIADVDDHPTGDPDEQCEPDMLNLRLKINNNEVVGAFDNVRETGSPDTQYNGFSKIVTIPFDPAFLFGSTASPRDPGLNDQGITLYATGDMPEAFAVDYAEIFVDFNCTTQWPACNDGRNNDTDFQIDMGQRLGTDDARFFADPGCTDPVLDNDESNPFIDPPCESSSSTGSSAGATEYCCMADLGGTPHCNLVTPDLAYTCQFGVRYADALCGGACPDSVSSASTSTAFSSSSRDSSLGGSSAIASSAGSIHSASSSSASSTQTPAVCGDAVRDGSEGCDDGNRRNGDGCSSICAKEPGWECTSSSGGGSCSGKSLRNVGDLFLSHDGRYLAYSEDPRPLGSGPLLESAAPSSIKTWVADTQTGISRLIGGARLGSSPNGRFHVTVKESGIINTGEFHDMQTNIVHAIPFGNEIPTIRHVSDNGTIVIFAYRDSYSRWDPSSGFRAITAEEALSFPPTPPSTMASADGKRFIIDNNTFNNGAAVYATVNGRTVKGFYWIKDSVTGAAQMAAYSFTETIANGTARRVQPDINRSLGWYAGIRISGDGYAAAYVQARFADGADRENPQPEDAEQSIIFFNARTGTFTTLAGASCGGGSSGQTCEPVCGDNLRVGTEQCDDGNRTNGDGCSSLCTTETARTSSTGSTGSTASRGSAASIGSTGNTSSTGSRKSENTPIVTLLPRCGDGIINGSERCDDGVYNNDALPDACRTDCTPPRCGDAIIDSGEQCDDGNGTNDDACSNGCRLGLAEVCMAHTECESRLCIGGSCEPADVCGNGVVDAGEICDDGDIDDHNLCTSRCAFAEGQICGNNASCDSGLCLEGLCVRDGVCGDGIVDANLGEECDQGAGNSDSIANRCRLTCILASLGDGVIDNGEECDDGNRMDGDGCTAEGRAERVAGGEAVAQGQPPATDGRFPAQSPLETLLPAALLAPPLPTALVGGILDQQHGVVPVRNPETGPAAVFLMASGAAAGMAWMRRKRR